MGGYRGTSNWLRKVGCISWISSALGNWVWGACVCFFVPWRNFVSCGLQFHQYQVVGRALPTEADDHPKIYRMKLWATNEVRAKSKFWYASNEIFGFLGTVLFVCDTAKFDCLCWEID